jgi:hypothetical protein
MRVARLRLGDEVLELTEYLAPRGRPIPVDSCSNGRWFQHVAIIVRDPDEAYGWLHENKIQRASMGPQTIPDWNVGAADEGAMAALMVRHYFQAIGARMTPKAARSPMVAQLSAAPGS